MADELTIQVRRIYDAPEPSDGYRVLVDRLWPRGVKKDAAAIDEWCRDIAPSTELRRWYGHDPQKFPEFRDRYRSELDAPEHAATLSQLGEHIAAGLTLLTATREPRRSQAFVLAEFLAGGPARRRGRKVQVRVDD